MAPPQINGVLILGLVVMMLVTGVCNTLLTKYQDNQCVRNCDDPDPKKRHNFEQPVIQTAQMFVGEMGCWIFVGAYYLYRTYAFRQSDLDRETEYHAVNTTDELDGDNDTSSLHSNTNPGPLTKVLSITDNRLPLKGFTVGLLALPAICDICGTTLMNVGLLFVAPSIYQMTRGALVLFVGLFSVMFLGKYLHLYQWFALVTVVVGVAVVGMAGAIYHDKQLEPGMMLLLARKELELGIRAARTPEAVRTIIGVCLIAGAQIFTATQFVLEEYILHKYALEPLKVVGWEGTFGLATTLIGMVILHFTIGVRDQYGYFDMVEGWRQITTNKVIGTTSLLIMISIGGFNYFGLSVTRNVSATSRSTIDTCRTLFIWMVSLMLGWESFKWLQVLGFALLVYGTFLFNDIVRAPLERCRPERQPERLLPEEPTEHL